MLRMENPAYFVASCSKISSASGLFIRDSFKIDRRASGGDLARRFHFLATGFVK